MFLARLVLGDSPCETRAVSLSFFFLIALVELPSYFTLAGHCLSSSVVLLPIRWRGRRNVQRRSVCQSYGLHRVIFDISDCLLWMSVSVMCSTTHSPQCRQRRTLSVGMSFCWNCLFRLQTTSFVAFAGLPPPNLKVELDNARKLTQEGPDWRK